jgi:hypothetical protein
MCVLSSFDSNICTSLGLFVILLFITDPEKPVCVVTGLPAKYVFVTPVYGIPSLILESTRVAPCFIVYIYFISVQVIN